MKIYISSSWKNRDTVREIAIRLRKLGHEVYDFTDPNCRQLPEIPPEKFPEQFDPTKHNYRQYLNRSKWREAVTENRKAIEWADLIVLLLPCGIDATADWALGVGLGKWSIVVGHPLAGERNPVHLWANKMIDTVDDLLKWFKEETRCVGLFVCGGGCESCLAAK
jgi:hypothetical protein